MTSNETLAQKHLRISQQFLDAADRLFDEGDIIQTSEKLWGATVHAVKVLCIQRGWRHNKYALQLEAVRRVATDTGDSTLPVYFRVAQGDHINFYDDFMTAEAVDEDRKIVRELVGKILAAADMEAGSSEG